MNGTYKNILLVCADVLSKVTDYSDRATCVLFGDAAGAAVISASDEPGVIEVEIGADGTGGDTLTMLAFKEDSEEVEKRVSEVEKTTPTVGEKVVKVLKNIGGGLKSFGIHF